MYSARVDYNDWLYFIDNMSLLFEVTINVMYYIFYDNMSCVISLKVFTGSTSTTNIDDLAKILVKDNGLFKW